MRKILLSTALALGFAASALAASPTVSINGGFTANGGSAFNTNLTGSSAAGSDANMFVGNNSSAHFAASGSAISGTGFTTNTAGGSVVTGASFTANQSGATSGNASFNAQDQTFAQSGFTENTAGYHNETAYGNMSSTFGGF